MSRPLESALFIVSTSVLWYNISEFLIVLVEVCQWEGSGLLRILGIDPGYAIVGWGVIDYERGKFQVVDYGAITTPAGMTFSKRLSLIYDMVFELMERYHPEVMSIEKLFFQNNKTTAIDVAQARGVVMLAAEQHNLEIFEYTPNQVKQGIVGYGKAEKKQVMEMTRMILNLKEVPKPDDTADALGMAICHAHVGGSRMGNLDSNQKRPLKIRKGI